jgi:hypothetical protein
MLLKYDSSHASWCGKTKSPFQGCVHISFPHNLDAEIRGESKK